MPPITAATLEIMVSVLATLLCHRLRRLINAVSAPAKMNTMPALMMMPRELIALCHKKSTNAINAVMAAIRKNVLAFIVDTFYQAVEPANWPYVLLLVVYLLLI